MQHKTFYSSRRTDNKDKQVKKHYTQMTLQEKKHCVSLLRKHLARPNQLTLTDHCEAKLKGRIDFKLLLGYIFKSPHVFLNVIEYNVTTYYERKTRRIVLKHPRITNVKGTPCFQYLVIDLDKCQIITTYYNKLDDRHKTLDLKYYDENLKII